MPDATNEHEGTNASPQIEASPAEETAPIARKPQSPGRLSPRSWPIRPRQWLLGAAGVLILVVACVFGIPRIELALDTVSTDDAYVNGHVTFVAPRVGGQISQVVVEDNNRVHKGEILARLD